MNANAARLERALRDGLPRGQVLAAHNALLEQLRSRAEAPDWDQFPLARDFFTQRIP